MNFPQLVVVDQNPLQIEYLLLIDAGIGCGSRKSKHFRASYKNFGLSSPSQSLNLIDQMQLVTPLAG